ncbi:hypothetical protein KSP40_PGU001978 [Platanthera guangdongensis]|uniref:Secreted protein n=1 Tax=Platanthera guangdongensis TaxID=2320717 RepID=A0ABR2LW58_9ASPA
MHAVRGRLYRALLLSSSRRLSLPSSSIVTLAQGSPESQRLQATFESPHFRTLASPWAATQRRWAKVLGSDVISSIFWSPFDAVFLLR